jgi:hypothetical protein
MSGKKTMKIAMWFHSVIYGRGRVIVYEIGFDEPVIVQWMNKTITNKQRQQLKHFSSLTRRFDSDQRLKQRTT